MIADTFTYFGYSMGWAAVRRMPEKRAYGMFSRLSDQVWRRHGPSVKQYERNLRRVAPTASPAQIRQLSRAGLQSYAHYWCDAFRMPDWSHERIVSLPVDGLEHIETALADGGRLVFTGPHSGNYDHGAAFIAQRFGSLTTVAERLNPPKLFERFLEYRQSLGMEIIGTGQGDIVDTLLQRIDQGRIIGLVGDRDLSRHGVAVDFFGEPTRFPAGPAVVARRAQATLLAVFFFYRDGQPAARVFPPINVVTTGDEASDVSAITQSVADAFATGIAGRPSDWHMLQPLWLSDLDPARDPMRKSGGMDQ